MLMSKGLFSAVVDTFCAQSAGRNLDYYLNLNAIFLQQYSEINSNNPEKKTKVLKRKKLEIYRFQEKGKLRLITKYLSKNQ